MLFYTQNLEEKHIREFLKYEVKWENFLNRDIEGMRRIYRKIKK